MPNDRFSTGRRFAGEISSSESGHFQALARQLTSSAGRTRVSAQVEGFFVVRDGLEAADGLGPALTAERGAGHGLPRGEERHVVEDDEEVGEQEALPAAHLSPSPVDGCADEVGRERAGGRQHDRGEATPRRRHARWPRCGRMKNTSETR